MTGVGFQLGLIMSRLQILMLLLPLLCVSATDKLWQEGEILSRKTVVIGLRTPRTAYVYRIRAGSREYVARFEQPLLVTVYAPVKFSVSGRHLLVQDADGNEQRAALLQTTATTLHR